jgi:signal transduction histidine kinase
MEPSMDRSKQDHVTLAELAGDALIARVLAGRGAHLFVLDAGLRFAHLNHETAGLLGDGAPVEIGALFSPETFLPSARVSEQITDALAGVDAEPCLVVLRRELASQRIRQLDVFPVRSQHLPGGAGVLCLLTEDAADRGRYALDSVLFSATLSERLQRERLETAQALVVTIRHEINNALTSLIGNGDLLLRRADHLDDVSESRVREILSQAYRIRDVLGKLEALTSVRTTTYLDGVRMVDLQPPAGSDGRRDEENPKDSSDG